MVITDRAKQRNEHLVLDHPPSSEASECALVVTGAYDRRLRLWDIAAAAATAAGGRGEMLGTLSSKVRQSMLAPLEESIVVPCRSDTGASKCSLRSVLVNCSRRGIVNKASGNEQTT